MLDNLIKLRDMVSTSNRDMAQRGLNPNIITIVAKAITDQIIMMVNVIAVVLLINQKSVQHMEKNVTSANHFSKLCRSSKSTGGGSKAQNHLHCHVHEMEEKAIQFQYDTYVIKMKRTLIQFTTPVYESSKELSSNVAFDEIRNQPKCLQYALTDLKLRNKAGNSDKVCFK